MFIRSSDVGKLLGCTRRAVYQLDARGALPKQIRFLSAARWEKSEILAWLRAGRPPRDVWEQTQAESFSSKRERFRVWLQRMNPNKCYRDVQNSKSVA